MRKSLYGINYLGGIKKGVGGTLTMMSLVILGGLKLVLDSHKCRRRLLTNAEEDYVEMRKKTTYKCGRRLRRNAEENYLQMRKKTTYVPINAFYSLLFYNC